jgi:hypothetical protein
LVLVGVPRPLVQIPCSLLLHPLAVVPVVPVVPVAQTEAQEAEEAAMEIVQEGLEIPHQFPHHKEAMAATE